MFIAINEDGKRVYASKDLPRDVRYFCPVCKGEVRLRAGSSNAVHFAHIDLQDCTDDFTHDMSEWHKAWQMMFPLGNREVVITHENETHRADVLCYGTVIEFQHSPISEGEFWRRNDFYTSAGYKVVWVFDAIDLYCIDSASKRISVVDEWRNQWDNGAKFTWKRPWRFLNGLMPQIEKDIDVYFQLMPFGNNPKSQEADSYIERVVWVNPYYKTLWGWFHTSYTATNYAELLALLKERWSCQKEDAPPKIANYKYNVDGEMVEASEFDDYLKKHYPYHVLEDGQRNDPSRAWSGAEPFVCPNTHQKPRISANMCRLGCYCCFAIEELSKTKRYVYCKHPLSKGEKYDAKVFRRVYK